MATTYNNLYLDARARLKKAGVEAAQLEKRVEELVQRRLAGVPVAYIIGEL